MYKTFEQYYSDLFDSLKLQIASEGNDYIIATPTEDLVKYYLNDLFNPLEFDSSEEESFEHKSFIKTIPAHHREGPFQNSGDLKMECEKIIVKLPIIPNKDKTKILQLRTSSFSMSGEPNYTINNSDISIEFEIKGYGINIDDEQIVKIINEWRTNVQHLFTRKNAEIISENQKIESNLIQFINERKNKLDANNKRIGDLVKLVKIPLARKDDDLVKKIYIEKKPFVKKIKPKTPEEDYQLDRERVMDIIKLIHNQCLQFEKTPKTYDKLDEPNLRDLILANLNSIFEGQATGETFNSQGKTDIYLIIDKGNILVSECKFYGGLKLYHSTINQLLGYLTWRQNYGIMINFCKQKNFTKIIEEAKSTIMTHESFETGFIVIGNTHFISKNRLPGDEYKHVEIHHLFYNLYFEKK